MSTYIRLKEDEGDTEIEVSHLMEDALLFECHNSVGVWLSTDKVTKLRDYLNKYLDNPKEQ